MEFRDETYRNSRRSKRRSDVASCRGKIARWKRVKQLKLVNLNLDGTLWSVTLQELFIFLFLSQRRGFESVQLSFSLPGIAFVRKQNGC